MLFGDHADTRRRDRTIDTLRGLLVLAVIAGHYAEITDRTSFLTWLGAGVRMPLFIGLTGYLFNLGGARSRPLAVTLHRYGARLIAPWLIACGVYLTCATQLTPLALLAVPVRPPFHFWFVPVMMSFIIIAALSRRTPLSMLGVAIPVSIAAMYLLGVQHVVRHDFNGWMPDRRFFIFPIYFFYGVWVADRAIDRGKICAALVLAPIGLVWWCTLYAHPSASGEVAASLIASLSLICLLPGIRASAWSLPVIGGIGRHSLFFYLWHPMVFGLWSSAGIRGVPMLGVTILSLALACAWLTRHGAAARVFGVTVRTGPSPAREVALQERLA